MRGENSTSNRLCVLLSCAARSGLVQAPYRLPSVSKALIHGSYPLPLLGRVEELIARLPGQGHPRRQLLVSEQFDS